MNFLETATLFFFHSKAHHFFYLISSFSLFGLSSICSVWSEKNVLIWECLSLIIQKKNDWKYNYACSFFFSFTSILFEFYGKFDLLLSCDEFFFFNKFFSDEQNHVVRLIALSIHRIFLVIISLFLFLRLSKNDIKLLNFHLLFQRIRGVYSFSFHLFKSIWKLMIWLHMVGSMKLDFTMMNIINTS